jgi:hypothetical protein
MRPTPGTDRKSLSFSVHAGEAHVIVDLRVDFCEFCFESLFHARALLSLGPARSNAASTDFSCANLLSVARWRARAGAPPLGM